MPQATTQPSGSGTLYLFGFAAGQHRDQYRLKRSLVTTAAADRANEQQWHDEFFRQITRAGAVTVKTTTFPALEQSGGHDRYLETLDIKIAQSYQNLRPARHLTDAWYRFFLKSGPAG
jgi:hypothetical protein